MAAAVESGMEVTMMARPSRGWRETAKASRRAGEELRRARFGGVGGGSGRVGGGGDDDGD